MNDVPPGVMVMDETFFTAQRRHRRTARLYSMLAAFAALLQGIPLAIILSPVFLGAAVLIADVINLWVPMPNVAEVIGRMARTLAGDSTVTETGAVERTPGAGETESEPLLTIFLLVVPGLVAMLLLWWLVRRFMIRDGLGGILLAAGARPPQRVDDEEHQLVNVVEEIAIAAGIQPPRVLVLPAEVPNAAAFGRSPDTWTIAVSRGLLDDLDRDATQGVIAHLVGSVGNGDLRMQHSLLALYVSHQLAQDIISAPFARESRRRVRLAGRMLRGKASPEEEAQTLRRLLTEAGEEDSNNFVLSLNFLTFKIIQFYTNIFVVGGILTLPFRVRRYLADATAVELTRTPDGVGRALVHLQDHRSNLPGAGFAAIYTVTAADPSRDEDSVEESLVLPASLHPPLHKRVERLHRLGFSRPRRQADAPRRGPGQNWPAPLRWLLAIPVYGLLAVIGVPLVVVFACLVLAGIFLSMFLGFLFWAAVTGVIVGPLHAVLRGMA